MAEGKKYRILDGSSTRQSNSYNSVAGNVLGSKIIQSGGVII